MPGDRKTGWLLFAAAFLLYARTIAFDYALDDRVVTFQNRFVSEGLAGVPKILSTFYWAGFWDANAGIFRPMSLLLFALEWQILPNDPHLFHLVNVILYALTAMLLYRVLRMLLPDRGPAIPLIAAVLWIVHPTHTEVVANIKSADEILAVLFALLALRAFVLGRPIAGAVLFFCALLSKEAAILFAPLMLLPRRETRRTLIALGVTVAVWFAWHRAVITSAPLPPITYRYVDNSLVAAPDFASRIATALQIQGRYLLKTVAGYPLSYDHSFQQIPNITFAHPTVWISLALVLALLGFAISRLRRDPVLALGILFFFLTLSLTSNLFILIGSTMADRFLFAPTIGYALCVATLLAKLPKKEDVVVLTGLIAIVYAMQTWSRSADWRSDATLFTADVARAPDSGRVRRNYGTLLMNRAFETPRGSSRSRMLEVADLQFRRAVEIDPLDYEARFSLGQVEYQRANYGFSARWTSSAIDTWRRLGATPPPAAYMNLGDARMMLSDYAHALEDFNTAAQMEPANGRLAMKVGNARFALGDTKGAAEAFETAVRLDPSSAEAWDKLANTQGMLGNEKRSKEAFAQAARLGKPAEYVPPILKPLR